MQSSPRAGAKSSVAQSCYVVAISKWLAEDPVVAIRIKVGAVLAKSTRQVSPCMVRALKTPIIHLLGHGCSNGLIIESKLRHALSISLGDAPHLLADWPLTTALSDLCRHFIAVLGMVRAYARETQESSRGRRFPRSGGFRRKCQMHDMDLLEQISALITQDDITQDDITQDEATTTADCHDDECTTTSPASDHSSHQVVPLAWPSFCRPSSEHSSQQVVPLAWPSFCRPEPGMQIPPIDPVAASRKRTAHDPQAHQLETPPKAKKEKRVENPLYAQAIEKVSLSHTTEQPSRSEITGTVHGKRIHVITLRERQLGPKLRQFVEELKTSIEKFKLCRNEAEAIMTHHQLT